MKKTLAILLALALVFSTVTVAFAEETLPADAKACKDLNMLVGGGNGVTNEYLATAPSRIQAAVMFLRLKGLYETALAYTGTDNFADADTAAWAKPIMAYLKANPTLGFNGIGGDKFDPNGSINAASYYKVMLTALGYKQNSTDVIGDFTFENTLTFAAEKGLSKVAAVTNFTVNNVATATIEALKTAVKGSTKTLAASLVEAKVITEAAAIAAGVYNPVPAELAVESVTTDNLKQLTVKFNKEIKEAGDEDNYSLETDDAAVLDEFSDFTLKADKKTVVITLTHDADQQEVVELTIEDITAVDGTKLAKTVVEDIELLDNTIPSALSAKVIGNDTIKVIFSEPVEQPANDAFEVDGGDYIVKEVNMVNNNTEANVVLYSELDGDKVTIEATNDVEDFAGFGIAKKEFELAVVEDTTAPVIVGYEDATPKGVTLIFSEDIQLVDGALANFYHTNSENTVMANVTDTAIDGNKLELDFYTDANNNNLMPEGTAYVYVAKEAVADLWDNENTKLSYKVEVELDKTAPTVTKVEAGDHEDELVVTYSEKMDVDTVEDEDNYTILDKDGKEVADIISSVVLDSTDEDFVTITFTEELDGDYSIVIDDVEDQNENSIVKVTKAFNIDDVTNPLFTDFTAKIYKASASGQMVKVSFGEEMAVEGKYSVLDLEKYKLGVYDLTDIEDVTIKAVDGNKAVEIKIPYDETADVSTENLKDGVNFTAADDLVMARVADAAGNYTALLSSATINVVPAGSVAIDVTGSSDVPKLTAEDTVVVKLEDRLTKFVAADFIIENSATGADIAISRVRHTVDEDNMSIITFTLATDVNTNATIGANNIAVLTTGDTASANIYGEELQAGFSIDIADKAAPIVKEVKFISATQIEVTFSEILEADTFAAALKAKNGFSVSGGTLDRAYISGGVDGTVVVLTSIANSNAGDFTVNTNVSYNSVAGVKDLAGNKLADFTETDKLAE